MQRLKENIKQYKDAKSEANKSKSIKHVNKMFYWKTSCRGTRTKSNFAAIVCRPQLPSSHFYHKHYD